MTNRHTEVGNSRPTSQIYLIHRDKYIIHRALLARETCPDNISAPLFAYPDLLVTGETRPLHRFDWGPQIRPQRHECVRMPCAADG